ncbi:septum formation family protein [Streptomyces roseirectus]|uniref:Septum formation family protein n=1 Tax=Streptomyces roseirectus TaxID=2768066 RepID=A0A7H0IG99_9ACTN|nr:septum formation family protein [Streptomyces roseirectus]QNP71815.1 septum formation family protein [Streptomyces roseirectus]
MAHNFHVRLGAALITAVFLTGCATTDSGHDEKEEHGTQTQNPFEAMGKNLPQGKPVSYSKLAVGTCSNYWGEVTASQQIGTVDCTDPHLLEIVSKIVLKGDAKSPYPGQQELVNQTRTACEPTLEPVVAAARGTRIALYLMAYDKQSWAEGNRTGYCAVAYSSPTAGKVQQ